MYKKIGKLFYIVREWSTPEPVDVRAAIQGRGQLAELTEQLTLGIQVSW